MKLYHFFVLASLGCMVLAGCSSNDREKGIGAYRATETITRSTITNVEIPHKISATVGISEDRKSFLAWDSAGVILSLGDLKYEHGIWVGTDKVTHHNYQVIFNDQKDQFLFSVTDLTEKACVIYLIPKETSSWSTWSQWKDVAYRRQHQLWG